MASIIKRCGCGAWDDCPHPWIVRYRTPGGRSSRQREQSFGDDLREAEDFLLKVEHDKKAHVFIDPKAGTTTFRAEAGAWLAHLRGSRTRPWVLSWGLRGPLVLVDGGRPGRVGA